MIRQPKQNVKHQWKKKTAQTEGGPPVHKDLNELEVRLIKIKRRSAVVGDNTTSKAGFDEVSFNLKTKCFEKIVMDCTYILLSTYYLMHVHLHIYCTI